MGCRLGWRLLARGNLLLDAGDIGSDFENRRSAIEALTGLLVTFPIWGRVDEEDYWWALARQRPTSRSASSYISQSWMPRALAWASRKKGPPQRAAQV